MSIQSAILGYGFLLLFNKLTDFFPFTLQDSVILQTVSVATCTMPLTAGFVGIVPALSIYFKRLLDDDTSTAFLVTATSQIIWCFSIAFLGVFLAIPLRKLYILEKKLLFPFGVASASVLLLFQGLSSESDFEDSEASQKPIPEVAHPGNLLNTNTNKYFWLIFFFTFALSAALHILFFFFPFLDNFKIFDWIHFHTATEWQWWIRISFGHIGQGMLLGFKCVFIMFLGSLFSWGILGPIAYSRKWCFPVIDWYSGCDSWVLWVAITILVSESFAHAIILCFRTLSSISDSRYVSPISVQLPFDPESSISEELDIPDSSPRQESRYTTLNFYPISKYIWISGFILSTILCCLIGSLYFRMNVLFLF